MGVGLLVGLDMRKTIYRKCPCGETAHDYDGHRGNRPSYKCRNCGAVRVPAKRGELAPLPADTFTKAAGY